MLKTLLILSVAVPSYVCAQTPHLGNDPIEKVINAMTLDKKLNLLIGSEDERKNFDVTTYNDGIYVGYRHSLHQPGFLQRTRQLLANRRWNLSGTCSKAWRRRQTFIS